MALHLGENLSSLLISWVESMMSLVNFHYLMVSHIANFLENGHNNVYTVLWATRSEDLCCNTFPEASHISSTIIALAPAAAPLKVHLN